ncbi:RNA polymerase sigma-70 factor [Hufsiella ginkgonis]|uniref:RNA polymerase sigma-70 factor n=1 Tax=Hufsiella ginkgonis TaxID=2695274 RepID=A0A7K1XYF2_9SPHI|nr:RNA polymerase sigma-70 factor [Hufsiella ginkgonis]MXV15769.1 RNA polymerase sigma-70 factor [Hufsiella ginkgonis]
MHNFESYTDNDLLSVFLKNEDAVFAQIYKRYSYKLFVFVNKRLRDVQSSEEIIQTIFVKFWTNRSNLKISSSLKSYLYSAAQYATIDFLHKEAVRKKYYDLAYFNAVGSDLSTEDQVLVKDLEGSIRRALRGLPAKCRSVFMLSRYEYKSNKEIAAELGISEKTVENHITNAIRRLRLSLKDSICVVIAFVLLEL